MNMAPGWAIATQLKKVRPWHVTLCAPFLLLLILLIPDAFCLQLDPDDGCPWYWMVTMIPAIIGIFFFYPATLATRIVGAQPLTLMWVFFCIVYASVMSYGLYVFASRPRDPPPGNRSAAKTRQRSPDADDAGLGADKE